MAATAEVLTELFALVGFKIDDKPMVKFMGQIYGGLSLMLRFTDEATRAIVALDNFNKITGVSGDVVRQWGFIAEQANVRASSIISAFETITRARGDMLAGRSISNAWALLGVDPSQDPEQVFNEVLNKLGQIKDINLRNVRISDLGFDPQLVNLIGKTREELQGVFVNLQVNDEEKQSLLDLKKSFVDLRITFALFTEKIAAAFFPIKSTLDLVARIIYIFHKAIDATVGWERTLKILTGTVLILFAKAHPIIALLTGIALIIEDVWTYFEGGESVLGLLIEKFKSLGIFSKISLISMGSLILLSATHIIGLIKNVWSLITNLKSVVVLFKLLSYINPFGGIGKIVTTVLGYFGKLILLCKALWGWFVAIDLVNPFILMTAAVLALIAALYMLYKFWKNRKKKDFNIMDDEGFRAMRDMTQGLTPNMGTMASVSNINNNPQITNNFNIDGSKNPQATANEIFNYQSQLNQTSLMFQ